MAEHGVLADVSGILGRRSISIASVSQKEANQESVPMVILTHKSREADMQEALAEIDRMPQIVESPMMIRIEDL